MATTDELRQYMERLEDRIRELEQRKDPERVLDERQFEDIKFFPLLKIDKLIFTGIHNQNAEPTIPANSIAFWIDADGGPAYYIIFNYNGTAKKVALT